MGNYFDGYYYKHQKGDDVLSFVVGRSNSEEFIQVITRDSSYNVPFIGENYFSDKGVSLNIKTDEISLNGDLEYRDLSPIKYDIMGPFKYFPMECRHGIISMRHTLEGRLKLNGKEIDFTNGLGYIEKDSGRSFPSSYVWVQANDFDEPCSIMASVADIPFLGFHFKGCICIIQYNGTEYRMATYLGVKVIKCAKDKIILEQGKYKLEIDIDKNNGQELSAPSKGEMTRTIIETAACAGEFRFYKNDDMLFSLKSNNVSFEYEA